MSGGPGDPALTWTCHVCGRERPDAEIGVISHKIVYGVRVDGEEIVDEKHAITVHNNVRFCRDDKHCRLMARLHTHDQLWLRKDLFDGF